MQQTEDIKSKRMRVLEKENYKVDLEYNEDFAILHLPEVSKFTRDVYFDMQFCLEDFKEFLKCVGYENLYVGLDPTNKLMAKFCKKIGFEYLGTAEEIDVMRMEIV